MTEATDDEVEKLARRSFLVGIGVSWLEVEMYRNEVTDRQGWVIHHCDNVGSTFCLEGKFPPYPDSFVGVHPTRASAVDAICDAGHFHMLRLRDEAPYALTDQHAVALTRAIEAEGYRVLVDPETGDVKLERRA